MPYRYGRYTPNARILSNDAFYKTITIGTLHISTARYIHCILLSDPTLGCFSYGIHSCPPHATRYFDFKGQFHNNGSNH